MLSTIYFKNYCISTYSLLFAFGIISSFILMLYLNKNHHVKTIDIIFCFPYWLISFLIGAKIFYIVENLDLFLNKYYRLLAGGFNFTGGLIGGILGVFLYCKLYKICFPNLLGIYIISFPIIYSFGKVGCFFAGCCNSMLDIPIQLIEAFVSLTITIYVFYNIKSNLIICNYLMIYSIVRFTFDFLRGSRNVFIISLSLTQIICIVIFVSVCLIRRKYRKLY